MHEVLFRGKEVADGKWIEGFYSAEEYNPYSGEVEHIPRIQIIGKCVSLGVIPETVGQFTGLTDKNGRKIFEEDIVDYISSDVIGNPKTGTIIVEDMTDYDTMIYLNHSDELQIIGNIHDNPELLKGGGNNG